MDVRAAISRRLPPGLRARLIRREMAAADWLARSGAWGLAGRALRPLLVRRYLRRPDEIDIEVTSGCDADCIMCPRRSMRRAPGPMDLALFRKIVDEAILLGVRTLVLNGYGEIATLRNYAEYLAYIRLRSRAIRILVNTNGMRMTEEFSRTLIENEVDLVNVTIDGATAQTFESIRRFLSLSVVESNVLRLMELRRAAGRRLPLVTVHMIVMPENAHESDAFLAKWAGKVDSAGLTGLVSRAGAVKNAAAAADWRETPCFLLWKQMPVLSDGSVAMCCDDWDGQRAYGNLTHQSIRDVWRSSERARVRALHERGESSTIDLCDACRLPRRPPWWF